MNFFPVILLLLLSHIIYSCSKLLTKGGLSILNAVLFALKAVIHSEHRIPVEIYGPPTRVTINCVILFHFTSPFLLCSGVMKRLMRRTPSFRQQQNCLLSSITTSTFVFPCSALFIFAAKKMSMHSTAFLFAFAC